MRQNSKRFRLDVWGWTTIVILLLYALFLLYPLSLLLKMAFSDGVHFTLENFAKFFSRKYYSITLLNSFKVSIAATIASVVVGVVLGYFMSVFKVRGAKLLRMCIVMATMSAPFVGAYAWIMLLGRNGVITNFLSGLFGIHAGYLRLQRHHAGVRHPAFPAGVSVCAGRHEQNGRLADGGL